MKQAKLLILVLGFLVVLTSNAFAASSPEPLSRTLKASKFLKISGPKCDLTVKKSSFSKTSIKCGKKITKVNEVKGGVKLLPKQGITVKAKKCFLVIADSNANQISLACLAAVPTETPAATNTPVSPTATPTSTPDANVLLSGNKIVSFNKSFAEGAPAAVELNGINVGDVLKSIDRRPNNGMLYGLGFNATSDTMQLYLISTQTGICTAVGSTGSLTTNGTTPVLTSLGADDFIGIDFNPSADRIRVVTSTGLNFRINPNTGAFIDGDNTGLTSGNVSGTNPDGDINTGASGVDEAAYTNNSPNNGNVTTLYTLDPTTDKLFIQNPPNAGNQVSGLNLSSNVVAVRGFDILSGVNANSSNTGVTTGKGFAILELASSSQQLLSQINLTNGAISETDLIGGVTDDILGLALQTESSGTPLIALSADGGNLLRFNSSSPGTVTTQALGSPNSGETLVGIDFRPATGQLYSLGVNPTTDAATLYLVDPQIGTLTQIGSTGSIEFVDANSAAVGLPSVSFGYGFNFNPTVDRIRVVTGTGLNFRIVPSTGLPVDGNLGLSSNPPGINPDGAINGATTSAHGTSYTNSFAQPNASLVTTQYTLDATNNSLYIQNPPNTGTETLGIPVTLNGNVLDFNVTLGFDVPPEARTTASNTPVSAGFGYAVLTVGSTTSLYKIDLLTGVATNLGNVGTGATGISGLAVPQSAIN